jgi:hypothetical protein
MASQPQVAARLLDVDGSIAIKFAQALTNISADTLYFASRRPRNHRAIRSARRTDFARSDPDVSNAVRARLGEPRCV